MPKQVTATMTKSLRTGKVFLDWSQNSAAKTTIAPYSLRGREHPTVAAPRTWDEIDDPKLRHLRFDEVLERVETGRRPARGAGRERAGRRPADDLPQHARRGENTGARAEQSARRRATTTRSSSRSTTPAGCTTTSGWSVTACWCRWAVPKNLPDTPSVNHLAVHTEDHPLEYLTFEGTIPKGEYGGGKVIVWDTGTYETEKFNDNPPDGPARAAK